MKRRKNLALAIFLMVWPFSLVSHAQEPFENITSREGYRQMQLTTDGWIPADGITNAVAWVTDHMAYDPDAWREFSSAAGPGGLWTSIGPGNIGGRIR